MDNGLTIACEGLSDEPVLRRLAEFTGFGVDRVFGLKGKGYLDKHLRGYVEAARFSKWLIVRDLDNHPCAFELRRQLIANPPPGLCFRLAVREIESWLLADAERFEEHFSTRLKDLSAETDTVPDPKQFLLGSLMRSSNKKVRLHCVRATDAGLAPGSDYTLEMEEFVSDVWRPDQAAKRSPSLRRAIRSLKRLGESRVV